MADKRKVLVDSMAIEKQNHADEVHRKLKEQGAAYEVSLLTLAWLCTKLTMCWNGVNLNYTFAGFSQV